MSRCITFRNAIPIFASAIHNIICISSILGSASKEVETGGENLEGKSGDSEGEEDLVYATDHHSRVIAPIFGSA